MSKVLVAVLRDTGVCESEPAECVLVGHPFDSFDTDDPTEFESYRNQFFQKPLMRSLAAALCNIEEDGHKLTVELVTMTTAEWQEICARGDDV
jgi:hypothetical protein